jgi:tyrosine-protein phosphatase YwqE
MARFTRKLVKKGYLPLMAGDAHDTRKRPPVPSAAVAELSGLIGPEPARAMVATLPKKIVQGEPWF